MSDAYVDGRLSVIVPVYNAERYLACCLESLLRQSYENLSIIVVDDESNDGSAAIALSYAARDSRIEVVCMPHVGLCGAREAGLEHADGEYVVFCDADDEVDENAYRLCIAAITQSQADYGCFGWRLIDGRGAVVDDGLHSHRRACVLAGEEILREFFRVDGSQYQGYTWNKIVRRRALSKEYFQESFIFFEDERFWVDNVAQSQKAVFIPEPHYSYRMSEEAVSTFSLDKSVLDKIEVRRRLAEDPEIPSVIRTLFRLRYRMFVGSVVRNALVAGCPDALESIRSQWSRYAAEAYLSNDAPLSMKAKMLCVDASMLLRITSAPPPVRKLLVASNARLRSVRQVELDEKTENSKPCEQRTGK